MSYMPKASAEVLLGSVAASDLAGYIEVGIGPKAILMADTVSEMSGVGIENLNCPPCEAEGFGVPCSVKI
jgi:nucleoside permease NupC